MTDTAIGKGHSDHFWGRVRQAIGSLRPVHQEKEPAYGQAAIARQIGVKPKVGARIEEELVEAWNSSALARVSMSLLVIEIDRYRDYYTTYGKGATDDCVRTVMQTIANTLPRDEDTCLRMGRATFVLALPDLPVLMARKLAADIAKAIREQGLAHKESHAGTVTLSMGLAAINPSGDYDRKFFEAGAGALKKAQHRGLSRLEVVDLRPAQERKRKAA